MRAALAAIEFNPWCTAAEPVAQAFSTRVARLKRRSGEACSTSAAVKSCAEKPALKWPSTISSTSAAATPASASAAVATRTIRLSTVSPSSRPKAVWAHPTMHAVTAISCQLRPKRSIPADNVGNATDSGTHLPNFGRFLLTLFASYRHGRVNQGASRFCLSATIG